MKDGWSVFIGYVSTDRETAAPLADARPHRGPVISPWKRQLNCTKGKGLCLLDPAKGLRPLETPCYDSL